MLEFSTDFVESESDVQVGETPCFQVGICRGAAPPPHLLALLDLYCAVARETYCCAIMPTSAALRSKEA